MPSPKIVTTGEIYWCEPDPKDTVGSEQEKDRPWVIVSVTHLHRGNCVVGVPLTKNLQKACAHLVQLPKSEMTMDGSESPYDSVALTDQIRALDKTRFRRKAGSISRVGLNAIRLGLQRYLGF
jgi:mRNA-degrading endonuclease toxin of MazEF toxin-antitoxin module